MRAGNSISAHTIISLQLLSLVLGARPRRPDLLQHTCLCARTGQAALTVSVRKTYTLSCLHNGVNDHSTELMFTDVTVAALLEPRSSDPTHMCVRETHRERSHSFWEPRQHVLSPDLCNTCICLCMCWQVTHSAKRTSQPKFSDLHTLTRAGNSISAQSTIISLQLFH